MSEDLTCPITHDYLQDPILLPCCGKMVSRNPLLDWFQKKMICPLCNANLTNFDAVNAVTIKDIISMIEAKKKQDEKVNLFESKTQNNWKATIHRLHSQTHRTIIGRLVITNPNDKYKYKTLLIPVIDCSGSMQHAFSD